MQQRLGQALLLAIAAAMAPVAGAESLAAQTGTIEVTVDAPAARPARRTAPGQGYTRQRARTAQDIPAIVYLGGNVAGLSTLSGGDRLEMVQRDTLFSPAALFVPVGGTVDFPNADPFFHNVFSYSSAQRFDLGRYSSGESKQVTFASPGVVDVFCEVHEHMRAVIVVTQNPFYGEVDEDGRIAFAGVPPGEYAVTVWHPEFRPSTSTVVLTADAVARVEVELKR